MNPTDDADSDTNTAIAATDVPTLVRQALDEVAAVFTPATSDAADVLCREILAARRIACYGVGREGLMMRALCMRLMHLGLDAHVVGDMTTPPIGAGDLLVVSAGPGAFSTVLGLIGVARAAGARVLVVTAQPGGEAARQADVVVHLPAQTMADDIGSGTASGTASGTGGGTGGAVGLLPMGSLYEAAQLILFDLVSIFLRERTGQSAEQMRARHTNLE